MTYGCEPRLHVLHKPESSTLAGIFVASNLWHADWQLSCDWNTGILISWQPGIAAVFGYSLSTGCYQIIVDKLDSVGGRFFTMVWSSAIGVKKGELIVICNFWPWLECKVGLFVLCSFLKSGILYLEWVINLKLWKYDWCKPIWLMYSWSYNFNMMTSSVLLL